MQHLFDDSKQAKKAREPAKAQMTAVSGLFVLLK
jgi:hypothetical protein